MIEYNQNQYEPNIEAKMLESLAPFIDFFKSRLVEAHEENKLLQKICDERLELIEKLHFEINSNAYLNPDLLLNELNAFMMELNGFYDQFDLHLSKIIKKPLDSVKYENNLSHLLILFKKTLHDLQNKCAVINEEKEKIITHQKRIIGYLRDKTVRGQAQFLKTRIRLGMTPKLGVLFHHLPCKLSIPKKYYKKHKYSKLPTISIVTPTFRQGIFLERTIKSILDQDYPRLEYIVQDGGCDQSTIAILQEYQTRIQHWESSPDSGQSHALNLGFRHTHGEIMAYLNSDDLLLPGSLHYIGSFFAKHPEVDVIYGHRILINEKDEEIGRWILPPHQSKILSWADYIPQESLFWRRRVWNMVGATIDESFRFAMDWDLLLRFREAGAKFMRLPRFIGAFRIHPHQKTSTHLSKTGLIEMNRLRERCHGRCISAHEIKANLRGYLYKHILCHRLYRLGILRY